MNHKQIYDAIQPITKTGQFKYTKSKLYENFLLKNRGDLLNCKVPTDLGTNKKKLAINNLIFLE